MSAVTFREARANAGLPFTVAELTGCRTTAAYERFGVPSYWIVDPNPAQPELTIFELRDGHYATVAVTTAPLTVERPFPITITPAQLMSRLRPRGTEAS